MPPLRRCMGKFSKVLLLLPSPPHLYKKHPQWGTPCGLSGGAADSTAAGAESVGGGEDYAVAFVCNVPAGMADGVSERLYPGWIDPRFIVFRPAGAGAWVCDAAQDFSLKPDRHDVSCGIDLLGIDLLGICHR